VLAGAASRRNIACGSTSALSSLAVVCAAKRGIIHARPESSSDSPIGYHRVSFNPETTIETVAAQVGLSPTKQPFVLLLIQESRTHSNDDIGSPKPHRHSEMAGMRKPERKQRIKNGDFWLWKSESRFSMIVDSET
jgi:hypothetical protein